MTFNNSAPKLPSDPTPCGSDTNDIFADLVDSKFDDLSDIVDCYVNDDSKEHKHFRIYYGKNKPDKRIVVSDGEGVEEVMGRLSIDEALSIRPKDDHICDFVFVYCDRNTKKKRTTQMQKTTPNRPLKLLMQRMMMSPPSRKE